MTFYFVDQNYIYDFGLDSESTISKCRSLLNKLVTVPKRYKHKSWFERMSSSQEQWRQNRAVTWNTLLSREVVIGICEHCEMENAVIRCNICYHNSLCHICDDIIHSYSPLHDRSLFVKGFQTQLLPTEVVNELAQIELTGTVLPILFLNVR